MRRHFTVTGFVVEGRRTLLHWHPKIGIWLPPGGHIEPDEDPVQATLREVREETGISGEVVAHEPPLAFRNVTQLPNPLRIIVADVPATPDEPAHQHIDLCYAVRPLAGVPVDAPQRDHGFVWVDAASLETDRPIAIPGDARSASIPDDVRLIGLLAVDVVARAERNAR